MNNTLEDILAEIQRTNPDMNREQMVYEILANPYYMKILKAITA